MTRTIAKSDVLVALRRVEMQQRLHRAFALLGGDQGIPDADPVADNEVQVAALSDAELLRKMYELVQYVPDPLADRFYNCLNECLARFAPELDWAQLTRDTEDEESHVVPPRQVGF